jgi:hypothetical protein
LNKANAVSVTGDIGGAVALCDEAITIWERLVNQEGRHELADFLTTAYSNKAALVNALNKPRMQCVFTTKRSPL